jgi:hypothetical protein
MHASTAVVPGEGNMGHRWVAYERSLDPLTFSVLIFILRMLVIILPMLLLALAASIADGGGEGRTADLVGIMLF